MVKPYHAMAGRRRDMACHLGAVERSRAQQVISAPGKESLKLARPTKPAGKDSPMARDFASLFALFPTSHHFWPFRCPVCPEFKGRK
jgi:hypothetical protein